MFHRLYFFFNFGSFFYKNPKWGEEDSWIPYTANKVLFSASSVPIQQKLVCILICYGAYTTLENVSYIVTVMRSMPIKLVWPHLHFYIQHSTRIKHTLQSVTEQCGSSFATSNLNRLHTCSFADFALPMIAITIQYSSGSP
jgi:hypothetical protein